MWVIFALSSALADSFKPLFGKKSMQSVSPAFVGWAQWAIGVAVLLPLFIVEAAVEGSFFFSSDFWPILLLNVVLNIGSTLLYWKAIQQTDLSLFLPIVLSATPLFLLITSPLMLYDAPSVWGFIGVITTVVGVYIINLEHRERGFWAPLLEIGRNRGLKYGVVVAGVWSITSNLDSMLVDASSPITYITIMYIAMTLVLLPVAWHRRARQPWRGSSTALALIGTGIASAFAHLYQMLAIVEGMVPYVLTLKRTSVLFAILWAVLFLKEKKFRQRFAGGLIIVAGAVIVIVLG